MIGIESTKGWENEINRLAQKEYNRLISEYPSWDEDRLWSEAYTRAEDYLIGLGDIMHDQAIDIMENS
tara:strand:- start:153 stop:356 length:204 start_codon:yes stop_codon:yes gene_type:complete